MAARINIRTAVPEDTEIIRRAMVDAAIACEAAKRAKDAATMEFAEIEQRYIEACQAAQRRGVETKGVEFTATNGVQMTVTFMDGTGGNSKVDEAELAKRIPKTVWKSIVTEVIDSAKLKAAITAGRIKAEVISACTSVGDKKSYGLFTAKTAKVTAVKTARRRAS